MKKTFKHFKELLFTLLIILAIILSIALGFYLLIMAFKLSSIAILQTIISISLITLGYFGLKQVNEQFKR